jgi:hypothetical protein
MCLLAGNAQRDLSSDLFLFTFMLGWLRVDRRISLWKRRHLNNLWASEALRQWVMCAVSYINQNPVFRNFISSATSTWKWILRNISRLISQLVQQKIFAAVKNSSSSHSLHNSYNINVTGDNNRSTKRNIKKFLHLIWTCVMMITMAEYLIDLFVVVQHFIIIIGVLSLAACLHRGCHL